MNCQFGREGIGELAILHIFDQKIGHLSGHFLQLILSTFSRREEIEIDISEGTHCTNLRLNAPILRRTLR
jgi:hypothetical protein